MTAKGWRVLFWDNENGLNWFVLIDAQFCKYTESHWIVHFKWVNMVCELYLNKSVIKKISYFPDSYYTTFIWLTLKSRHSRFFVCRPEGTDISIPEADFDCSFNVVFKFIHFYHPPLPNKFLIYHLYYYHLFFLTHQIDVFVSFQVIYKSPLYRTLLWEYSFIIYLGGVNVSKDIF